jgi:N-acetylglucosaminyl-diphospho-decaprenol L-rhamnosyltransferase
LDYFEDITVVLVLYNSEDVIKYCLSGFSQDQMIIAVDNASTDSSAALLLSLHPQAKLIQNTKNKGYGPAANQALTLAVTPYVLLINPDAVMKPGAISLLHKYAGENPDAGIIAPFLFIPNKGLELDLKGPKGAIYDVPTIIPEGPFSTWSATGAVWLARVSDWKTVGGFDENIFLYAEDLDFCLRLRETGKSILICPEAQGEHLLSRSTPITKKTRWRKEWNIVWSHLYVTRKHLGSVKTKAEIKRIFWRHFPKMLFHGIVFERKRFLRDLAIIHAIISFFLGHGPNKS